MKTKFKGFSTVDTTTRNYTLTDIELVKRDLLNELYTRKGERAMRPSFGSIFQDLIMEPYTLDIESLIEEEITRIISNEPRLQLKRVDIETLDHFVQVNVQVIFQPGDIAENLFIRFQRVALS